MKSIFQNLGLILIGTLIALLIGEVGLRIWGFQPGNPFERLINHNDLLIGYRMLPGMREDIEGPGGSYTVDIVSLGFEDGIGFRDDGLTEPAYSIFLGDSFVWGYGVDLADTVSEQFERLTGKDAVNMGMTSGTSPTQYARLFSEYGSELRPKIAFFGFYVGNDFGDSVHFSDWVLSGKEVSYPVWNTIRAKGYSYKTWVIKTRQFFYNNSSLYRFVTDRISFSSDPEDPEFDANILHIDTDTLDLKLHGRQLSTQWSKTGPQQIEIVRRAVRDIKRSGRKKRIKTVVFVIPTKEMVYQALFSDPGLRNVVDLHYSTLLGILTDEDLTYIDLLPIFRGAASRGEQLYFETDGHWTAAGHLLAATAIRDFLSASRDD